MRAEWHQWQQGIPHGYLAVLLSPPCSLPPHLSLSNKGEARNHAFDDLQTIPAVMIFEEAIQLAVSHHVIFPHKRHVAWPALSCETEVTASTNLQLLSCVDAQN